MPRADGSSPGDLLQSVQRACRLLALLGTVRRPMAPKELAERIGVNLSTTYHLINTLEHEGFLAWEHDRTVRLGHRIGTLHDGLLEMLSPQPRLLEFLDTLNQRTGETAYLGVWNGDDVVSAAVREGHGGVHVRGLYLGYQQHTYARALGRALLAYRDPEFVDAYLAGATLVALTERTTTSPKALRRRLDEVRRTGVAIEREEFTAGVCCAGAPVLDEDGEAVAALSVSVPKARFDVDQDEITRIVREVAEAATAALVRPGPNSLSVPGRDDAVASLEFAQ